MAKKKQAKVSELSEAPIEASPSQQTLKVAESPPKWTIQYRVIPDHFINVDHRSNEWQIEIHMPGVKKEDIKLRVLADLYDLHAKRSEQHYYGVTEYFPFEIAPESVQAKYDNGLLLINGIKKNPFDNAVDVPLS
jgi:HSP20 family protein